MKTLVFLITKDFGIFNNQRLRILNINTYTITIEDGFKKLVKIDIPDFQNIF